jgi:PIN domain nuclease of toxin-antitoxin system
MQQILDSSALLAYLLDETGAKVVEKALSSPSLISLINWAEILTFYAARGIGPELTEARLIQQGLLFGLVELVLPVEVDARNAADIYMNYPNLGLSLADRFCLATARRLGIPVLTADKAWTKLPKEFSVRCIR